jgi:PAS domain S-box-containing protein
VLVVDARRSLFRLVASWPSPSPSAEAVLVRRDGDSVLFLTTRRFQPGATPTPRIALSRRDVLAVKAVLGAEGVVRGVDYRGVKVISVLRAVPGTPWFLVAKVDEAEVLAVWRTRVALVFAVLLGLVLVAGASAIAAGQRSAKAHYRRMYEAEAALAASETRYRALVEEAGDDISLLDAEGRVLDVNTTCCQQLGYAREELLRLNISDVDTLFTPQRFAADFQSLLGKPPVTYASVHRRKDGTAFPVEVTLSVVPIGGVPQALSLARDITERKRAEEELKKSSQLLRDTGEMAEIGGWELDLSTQEVSWTEEVYRIHGVEPGHRPKVKDALSFYAPESRPAVEEALKKTAETGDPFALESLFIPRGSKDRIWVRSLGRAVYSSGKVVKLAGTFQNIDKYKRAEEALRREHAMFARTEGFAHVGSWEWDIASDTVTWSDELFRIFQRDPREGAPSFAEHPALYHPDDMARLRQAVEVAIAEGTPYELELRANRADGVTRVCVARGVAEMSPGGRAVRLCGSLQDITERKREDRTQAQLVAMLDATPGFVGFADAKDTHILYINSHGRRMVGVQAQET